MTQLNWDEETDPSNFAPWVEKIHGYLIIAAFFLGAIVAPWAIHYIRSLPTAVTE